MTSLDEMIAGGVQGGIALQGSIPASGASFTLDPLCMVGAARMISYGEVLSGNPNKDLLSQQLYSTNRLRFEVHQTQQQWNLTAYTLFECVRTIASKMDVMMAEIGEIRNAKTFVVPLTTLAHEPLQMRLNIPATIEGDGEDFTATFTEANVSASGETEADAIANLKESLVSTFEFLESLTENERGPLPTRQWEVLRNVLTR